MPAGERARWSWLAAALLAAVPLAHADYKDDYMRGKKAYEEGEYLKARELLLKALQEHEEPALRFNPYGKIYQPYLPQHYEGLAAAKLGDCAGALARWSDPAHQRVVGQLAEAAAEEQRARAACGTSVAAKPETKTAAPSVIPPMPMEARPAAPGRATSSLPKAPAEKPGEAPLVVAEPGKPALKPAEKPAEKPLEKPVTPATAAVDKAPAKNAPPEALVQAFEDYLAGRYADAAKINPDALGDKRARFHGLLVRAAAKYTLSQIGDDAALLEAARIDAAAARALGVRPAPDATLFSPGFRAFYQSGR